MHGEEEEHARGELQYVLSVNVGSSVQTIELGATASAKHHTSKNLNQKYCFLARVNSAATSLSLDLNSERAACFICA